LRLKYQVEAIENSGFFLTSNEIFSSLCPLALIFCHGLDAKSKGCALRISYRTVDGRRFWYSAGWPLSCCSDKANQHLPDWIRVKLNRAYTPSILGRL